MGAGDEGHGPARTGLWGRGVRPGEAPASAMGGGEGRIAGEGPVARESPPLPPIKAHYKTETFLTNTTTGFESPPPEVCEVCGHHETFHDSLGCTRKGCECDPQDRREPKPRLPSPEPLTYSCWPGFAPFPFGTDRVWWRHSPTFVLKSRIEDPKPGSPSPFERAMALRFPASPTWRITHASDYCTVWEPDRPVTIQAGQSFRLPDPLSIRWTVAPDGSLENAEPIHPSPVVQEPGYTEPIPTKEAGMDTAERTICELTGTTRIPGHGPFDEHYSGIRGPDRRMLEATRTALLHAMNGGNGSYDQLHGRLRSVWDMLDGYLEGAPGRESQP